MNEEEIQRRLADMLDTIDPKCAVVFTVQAKFDQLRLAIKCMLHDMESTRRENGYLRKMLEETGKDE